MTKEVPHAVLDARTSRLVAAPVEADTKTSPLAQSSVGEPCLEANESVPDGHEVTASAPADAQLRRQEEDLIGTIVSQRYKIIDEIGTGGMGKVYRAEHLLIGKVQAIKLLHRHLSSNKHSIQRFQTEAKAASSLRHDNLLTVTDFGLTESDQPFIVMDYIKGRSLSEILKDEGALSIASFIEIFTQVCKGLAHAHEKCVIHRDLKPSNIMIDDDGGGSPMVRIVDFGIAKILPNEEGVAQHLTQTGELFGSPLYMSPEQCHGGNIDTRSDIYSLGCAMFEALTGVPPLKGASVVETLLLHMREQAPQLSEACPRKQFPLELENIIAKALEKDREQRYQSAKELLDDLSRFRFHHNLPAPARDTLARHESAASPRANSRHAFNRALATGVRARAIGTSALVLLSVTLAGSAVYHFGVKHDASSATGAVTSRAASDELERATELTAAAWAKLEDAGAEPAETYAQKALEIRRRLAPNSEALAESLNQVAYLMQQQAIDFNGQTDEAKIAMAENMYKQAIAMSSNSKPYLIETGQPKYKRNLADLYMLEGKFIEAQKVLVEVLDGFGQPLDSLDGRDDYSARLMRQLARLSWGLNLDEQAAVLEVKLSVPTANVGNELKLDDHPDFAGDWHLPGSLDGYSFGVTLERRGSDHLVGSVSYARADGSRTDGDDEMTGTFNGPVANVSWTSGWSSETGHSKLVRVNDYLVWHWDKGAQGAMMPLTEVLAKGKGM